MRIGEEAAGRNEVTKCVLVKTEGHQLQAQLMLTTFLFPSHGMAHLFAEFVLQKTNINYKNVP